MPDSNATAAVIVEHGLRIPTDQPGVSLSCVVHRPDTSEPVPALVSVYPYRSDAWYHEVNRPYLDWFAERGYACVLVDLLGTGSSDGALRPFHDPSEADDGVWAVEWAARQDWCTGSVGMWGISFGGFMTMGTAQRNPAGLKAIMPLMNSTDPERETMHPGGARGGLQPLVQWGLQQLAYQLLPPLNNFDDPAEQKRWSERLTHAAALEDLSRHGPGHPVWQRRRLHPELISVPAFCVGGWRDSFQWSIPRAFELMQGPKRLMMGPWGHVIPQGSPFSPIDFRAVALRWWDHWLRGVDNGVMDEDPVLVYVQGHEPGWRSLRQWPDAASDTLHFHSHECADAGPDGRDTNRLRFDHPTGGSYRPDPRIGPYSGIQCIGASSRLVLPLDQHADDMRACTLTSAPVPADVEICGLPCVRLRIAPLSAEQASVQRLVVRLTDVDPAGRSTMITTAVASDLPTGDQDFPLWPTAYRLARGHRLRLAVSDSAFPWLVPLAHPDGFRISDITVSLPVLAAADSNAVDVPSVDRPLSGLTFADATWSTTEDPSRHGLCFAMWSRREYVVTQGHRVSEETASEAFVTRDAPQDVRYKGDHQLRVTLRSSEVVHVTASVHTTHGLMIASAGVTIGGVSAMSRRWTVPLATGPQD